MLYYIILSILESSMIFFVLYDCITCDCDRYYTSVIYDITLYFFFINVINLLYKA